MKNIQCENFKFIINTTLNNMYHYLQEAELGCYNFPRVTYTNTRIVMEYIFENLALKLGKAQFENQNTYAENLYSLKNDIPMNIFEYSNSIRINANAQVHKQGAINLSKTDIEIKSSLEVLEMTHKILIWYLKSVTGEISKDSKVTFIIPKTIEETKKELLELELVLKEKDKLQKYMNEKLLDINNTIEEKDMLENELIKIEQEKNKVVNELHDIRKNLNKKEEGLQKLKKQNTLLLNENLSLKEELDKLRKEKLKKDRELENLFKEKEELFNEYNKFIQVNENNNEIRVVIDKSQIEYKDALEVIEIIKKEYMELEGIIGKIENSKEDEIYKLIKLKQEKEKRINSLNLVLSQKEANCYESIHIGKQKIKTLKHVLNSSNDINNVEYEAFYRGFLSLEGEQLRHLYSILTNVNLPTILFNKSKNIFSKSDQDKFLEYIENKAKELENIPDEELRLKSYYTLVKITKVEPACIINDDEFKKSLDCIVHKGYEIVEKNKDFEPKGNKLEAIVEYYLSKVFKDFKHKFESEDLTVQEELVNSIYNNFENLPQDKRKEIYDKLHLQNTSETAVKSVISAAPFLCLDLLVSIGGISAYYGLSNIILGISQIIGVTFSYGVYTGAASTLSFLTGPFMIILLIINGGFLYAQHKKQRECLVPIFIMQLAIASSTLEDKEANINNQYKKMIELWTSKKREYDKKLEQLSHNEEVILNLKNSKVNLENNNLEHNKNIREYTIAKEKYIQDFKEILLSTSKSKKLNSYEKYKDLLDKKNSLANELKTSQESKGLFKSIFLKDTWTKKIDMVSIDKYINMVILDLIEEARKSGYFVEEDRKITYYDTEIEKLARIIELNNNVIEEKHSKIKKISKCIKEVNSDLKHLSDIYINI